MTEPTFRHHPAIRAAHPDLVAGVCRVDGITSTAPTAGAAAPFLARARARLGEAGTESGLPEIQAWRRAFAAMGLKPTQYRCASEALLRRLRTEGDLPAIHPLVDFANAVSVAFAIPIAVFDLAHVSGSLEVRPADGTERYEAFSGEIETPAAGEVVFADDDGWAHARRWTNRQSARSAIRPTTARVLLVAEAVHPDAGADVRALLAALAGGIATAWGTAPRTAILDVPGGAFAL